MLGICESSCNPPAPGHTRGSLSWWHFSSTNKSLRLDLEIVLVEADVNCLLITASSGTCPRLGNADLTSWKQMTNDFFYLFRLHWCIRWPAIACSRLRCEMKPLQKGTVGVLTSIHKALQYDFPAGLNGLMIRFLVHWLLLFCLSRPKPPWYCFSCLCSPQFFDHWLGVSMWVVISAWWCRCNSMYRGVIGDLL